MTGLTESAFDSLFECLELFLSALVYPDCKSSEHSRFRKMNKGTELLCFLTVLHHAVHLGVIGSVTNTSVSTQARLFVAWSVFLVAVFKSIDLAPLPGELAANLPKVHG